MNIMQEKMNNGSENDGCKTKAAPEGGRLDGCESGAAVWPRSQLYFKAGGRADERESRKPGEDHGTPWNLSLDVLYGRKELVDVLADYRTIPLLDAVQAGQWRTVDASTRDEWIKEVISVNMEYPPSTFATRIAGDSMEPRMKAGDVVVVDVTMQPRPGDIVVATNEDGEATIKQYRSLGKNERGLDVFELLPANPLYAPIRSDRENIAIVGVVREHRVFLR
jgi:SOS-response transcriptional repressor LexA